MQIEIIAKGNPNLSRTYTVTQEDIDSGAVEYMGWGAEIADMIDSRNNLEQYGNI